jgi:hypothetical protein
MSVMVSRNDHDGRGRTRPWWFMTSSEDRTTIAKVSPDHSEDRAAIMLESPSNPPMAVHDHPVIRWRYGSSPRERIMTVVQHQRQNRARATQGRARATTSSRTATHVVACYREEDSGRRAAGSGATIRRVCHAYRGGLADPGQPSAEAPPYSRPEKPEVPDHRGDGRALTARHPGASRHVM